MENVTRRQHLTAGGSGETSRKGSSGLMGGEEHLVRLQSGISISSEPVEERLSKERLRSTMSESKMASSSDGCTIVGTCWIRPIALSLVFRLTTRVESSSLHETLARVVEKHFRTKQGAPGPPKRIIDPRRTRWGMATPLEDGEWMRFPLTKVPCALPQSTI